MKTLPLMTLVAIIGFTAAMSMGQDPVITSFQGNGQLSWTNAVNSNAVYRVEWAAQADGPWHQNFDSLGSVDGLGATEFMVSVPMFYRVVGTTNEPPLGMVWIEGGDVELGQVGIAGSEPVHTNFISGFWMDATEVTKAHWDDVANWAATNGYDITAADGSGQTNNHPVQTVSWYKSVKWCNARSQKEGLAPCYYVDQDFSNIFKTGSVIISNSWVNWSANGYRLPTEAEWEKGARGARQGRRFPWGDTIQHTRANYNANTNTYAYDTSLTQGYHPDYQGGGFPDTSAVGSFPANGYGLHDMAGNVFEWCWDWYGTYTAGYQTDPHGPATGTDRAVRGGAWYYDASFARVARRIFDAPAYAGDYFTGFRCARGP